MVGHKVKIRVEGLGVKSEAVFVCDDAILRQVYDLKGVLGVEVGDRMFDVTTTWLDEVAKRPIPAPSEVTISLFEETTEHLSWWRRVLLFLLRNSH